MVSFMGDTTQANIDVPYQSTAKKMAELTLDFGEAITPAKKDSFDCDTIVL